MTPPPPPPAPLEKPPAPPPATTRTSTNEMFAFAATTKEEGPTDRKECTVYVFCARVWGRGRGGEEERIGDEGWVG